MVAAGRSYGAADHGSSRHARAGRRPGSGDGLDGVAGSRIPVLARHDGHVAYRLHVGRGRSAGPGARLRRLRRRHEQRRLYLCLRAHGREYSGPSRSVRRGCPHARLCAPADAAIGDASQVCADASGTVDLPNVSRRERRCCAPQSATSAGPLPCRACHDIVSHNDGPPSGLMLTCASDHP